MQTFIFSPEDRLLLLLFALAANALLMGATLHAFLPRSLSPLRWIDKRVALFEQRLNKEERGAAKLGFRGAFITLFFVLAGAAAGIILHWPAALIPEGWWLEVVVLALALGWRSMHDTGLWLTTQMRNAPLEETRHKLQEQTPYDTAALDSHGIYRMGIEVLLWRFQVCVVGGGVWYLALGLPGTAIHLALATAAQRMGAEGPNLRAFGEPSRRLHRVLQAIPSLITALLLSIGTLFAAGTRPGKGLKSWSIRGMTLEQLPRHLAADALDIQLGGLRKLGRHLVTEQWIGTGTPKAGEHHLRAMLQLYRVMGLELVLLLAAIYLLITQ